MITIKGERGDLEFDDCVDVEIVYADGKKYSKKWCTVVGRTVVQIEDSDPALVAVTVEDPEGDILYIDFRSNDIEWYSLLDSKIPEPSKVVF